MFVAGFIFSSVRVTVMAADPSPHLPIVTFPMQQGLGIAVQVSGRVVAPHALLLVV